MNNEATPVLPGVAQCKSWFVLSVVLLGMSGCVTATVQQVRETSTSMNGEESIAVLGVRTRPNRSETEMEFVDCVSRSMGGGENSVNVISEQEFVDALFPWFEPRTAPVHNTDLPALLDQPLLANRLREIGLKYLVWVEGNTRRTASTGSMSCTIAPGAGGCFGFLTWENDSSYEAAVWDVQSGKTAGRVSSDAIGTSYMPALVVPIPILARVRSSACSTLADQLKGVVNNET